MNWRTVDMSRESRRDQFAYFQTLSNPYVGVTVQVDVTELAVWCRERGTSFFLAMLYAAVRAANGVPELRLLTGEEARAMEPSLSPEVCGALYAPTAGVIDPWGFALAMIETAVQNGVELHRSCPVTAIEALPEGGFRLSTPKGSFTLDTRQLREVLGLDVPLSEPAVTLWIQDYIREQEELIKESDL